MTKRCTNAHPRLIGKDCNAIVACRDPGPNTEVQCARCHGWVSFAAEGTESDVEYVELTT